MSGPRRPVIAMTMWRRPLPTYLGEKTELFTIGTEYVASLERHGASVILLPGAAEHDDSLSGIDGLVLAGGEDIHPDRWGGQEDPNQTYDPLRDGSEISLYQRARKAKIPVLGICRGLQLIAVAEGIPLIPDVPRSDAHPGQSTPEELLGHRHDISIAPASKFAKIYRQTKRATNSIHHQAITAVPTGFSATAWTSDGIIEAIESVDGRVIAVQWHPEKMCGTDEITLEDALFSTFIASCSTSDPTQPLSERIANT